MRLIEVAGEDGTLTGWTFETCTMYGPAIIAASPPPAQGDDVRLTSGEVGGGYVAAFSRELRFEGDEGSVFYEIPSGGTNASGVIHLAGCHFFQVTFRNIGVAGTPEELESWRRSATFIPRER
jgi:hypothetical protein